MYRPDHFKMNEATQIQELIANHPLGVLIANTGASLQVNYLPFIMKDGFLLGHMAKVNTQLEDLDGNYVVVTFQGPDRYISPTWYKSALQVPTWNYAAVEIRGRIEILSHADEIEDILQISVDHFEKRNQTNWEYKVPEKFRLGLIKHIVGIKIHIEQTEGKFKLSQNRSTQDKESVQGHLAQSSHSMDLAMLKLMKAL